MNTTFGAYAWATHGQFSHIDLTVELPRPNESALATRVLAPEKAGRRPVILFSHGNMLSPFDYDPLALGLVREGFVVLLPAHGDAAETLAAIRPNPPGLWRKRIADMQLILNQIDEVGRALPAFGTSIDAGRIGVAGHSLGGHTVAALASQAVRDPDTGQWVKVGDPRIEATLLIAPPGHFSGLVAERRAKLPYLETDGAALRGPLLVIAGERDDSKQTTDRGAAWRMESYFAAGTTDKCLLRIAGADHYFGGLARRLDGATIDDAAQRDAVVGSAARFFKAALGERRDMWKRAMAGYEALSCGRDA